MTEPKLLELSPAERTWLANQQRKQLGQRSKYIPHQGRNERAKRLARLCRHAWAQNVPWDILTCERCGCQQLGDGRIVPGARIEKKEAGWV